MSSGFVIIGDDGAGGVIALGGRERGLRIVIGCNVRHCELSGLVRGARFRFLFGRNDVRQVV